MDKRIVAIVNLDAIKHNLQYIRNRVGRNRKILFAVKSDGYGHGAVEISRFVQRNNLADILGVASPAEGSELRNAGITLPILILGLVLPEKSTIQNIIVDNLSQTVSDFSLAQEISREAKNEGCIVNIHLKVDTGMGRIGCCPDEAVDIAKQISMLGNINLEGIFTHFPVSDEPNSNFTKSQIQIFRQVINNLEKNNIHIPIQHMSNSAAILLYPDSYFNCVRPGIMAYGYNPLVDRKADLDIIPSMTLKTYLMFIKRVKKGTPVSYGSTFHAEHDTNIATIPVGYGDGYNRHLSNKARVIIQDKSYPVVGRICMDQTLIDLGKDEYPLGQEVILFGEKNITADTVADWLGTIPYEVTCVVTKRVPRIYSSNKKLIDKAHVK